MPFREYSLFHPLDMSWCQQCKHALYYDWYFCAHQEMKKLVNMEDGFLKDDNLAYTCPYFERSEKVMEVHDLMQGSLYGLVYGDVLGCPIETWKQKEIEQAYGTYEGLPETYPIQAIKAIDQRKVTRLRPLGLHSDDGQQAMALLNVLLNNEGWSKRAWADMLVDGDSRRAWRGTGQFFNSAVGKMKKKERLEMTGSPSSGIGGAMRIAPVGALYHDSEGAVKKIAIESTLMTHGDIAAVAYAFAVAHATMLLVQGKTPAEVMTELPAAVKNVEKELMGGYKNWKIDRTYQHAVSSTMEKLFAENIEDIPAIRTKISELAKPHLKEGFSKAHPNQGFVLTGGLHALVMGLQSTMTPNEALLSIVRLGYDTDTVAAIAGGLLGARYGTEWIPMDRFYSKTRVESYGAAMITRVGCFETSKEFVTQEAILTKAERDYQMVQK